MLEMRVMNQFKITEKITIDPTNNKMNVYISFEHD